MFPSLRQGGSPALTGRPSGAGRGRVRAWRVLDHRLGQGLREHGMAHRSGQSELLLAERRVTERRARG